MSINHDNRDTFVNRHLGPNKNETEQMLKATGHSSIDALISETVPAHIRLEKDLNLSFGLGEHRYLDRLMGIALQNKVAKNYIGLGYYDNHTPTVIQRNILENPGWYTQYTPYQAEISQGRLEALLNFQTMICELTKMDIANASLLDDATAAAEAMTLMYRCREKSKKDSKRCFVSKHCFPQTIAVLKTRALPLGIELDIADHKEIDWSKDYFAAIVQYPAEDGQVFDYSDFCDKAKAQDSHVIAIADIMALTLLKPPGEWGASTVVGNTQRFGVPLGCGGPHAAYIATKDAFKRQLPGRIIGISKDRLGKTAYRMALQTREQHIRREKATSNICTAQALLAIMAGMYAVYHGPTGLKEIGTRIHALARLLETQLQKLGFTQLNTQYFDTLKIKVPTGSIDIINRARKTAVNLRQIDETHIGISLDETTTISDIFVLIGLFNSSDEMPEMPTMSSVKNDFLPDFPQNLKRQSPILEHPIFSTHHSESQMLRYIKSLENKDLSLTAAMIPLGSCTMKLNATTQMIPLSWPQFSKIHPYQPLPQLQGYSQLVEELGGTLAELTGFHSTSFQPNSGAQGEYAGLLTIQAYQKDQGQAQRHIVLIPTSAHGTNPASASMLGLDIVLIKCKDNGNIDIDDLKEKAETHKETLSSLMITYPSTHGVFEEEIIEICDIIHNNGGQVYMDGANMNAQVGLTSPGRIGADVCHLNLHKTFSIPHGGGGPGMGPICVAEHLSPYLPGHPFSEEQNDKASGAISSAPWSSTSILIISHAYTQLLGATGMTKATKIAILNANYIRARLAPYYPILFTGKNGNVAHELIIDLRAFKKSAQIDVEDVAKRLIDYGFHAPTMSWPVPGTLMIEPTESEDLAELDRFCDALIAIKGEIDLIESGQLDISDNPLKNAPHTCDELSSDNWPHPYSRELAAYPLSYIREKKFWPAVSRVDNAFGDRNLICTCPTVEEFAKAAIN